MKTKTTIHELMAWYDGSENWDDQVTNCMMIDERHAQNEIDSRGIQTFQWLKAHSNCEIEVESTYLEDYDEYSLKFDLAPHSIELFAILAALENDE